MGRHRTVIYADEIPRISVSMVKSTLALGQQRNDEHVEVHVAGGSVRLRVAQRDGHGVVPYVSGLECPRCGTVARVLGRDPRSARWACRACVGWRSRSRARRGRRNGDTVCKK